MGQQTYTSIVGGRGQICLWKAAALGPTFQPLPQMTDIPGLLSSIKRRKITTNTPRLPHTNLVRQATFTRIPCKAYDVQVFAHGSCSGMASVANLNESL